MRAVDRRLNVAIVGPRGTGKTSLLRQVQLTLRGDNGRVRFVDATAVTDPIELASRIRDALVGQPSPLSDGATSVAGLFRKQQTPIAGASRALAELLSEIGEADKTTILLDASASAEAFYGIFGRMRDVLWQQDHRWIVALDEADRGTALKPPADAFFDGQIQLEPWPTNDLIDLLGRRLDPNEAWDSESITSAASGAKGNPRGAVRALTEAILHDRDPALALNARGQLLDSAAQLGRPAGMLMAELLDRGQASPSDKELQQALGLTRSRLTQLFHGLLASGLVQADTERADGPGRPRIIYRPALPR